MPLAQDVLPEQHGVIQIMDDLVINRTPGASQARLLAGIGGPLLLGLGSGISVSAGFGAFGFSVLLDGIYAITGLPLWVSQILITLLFYSAAGIWAGIPLGAGTLPSLLLIGPAISLGSSITPDTVAFSGNLLAFVVGLLFFALGISLAAAAALGPDGITAMSLAAEKRLSVAVPHSNFTAITMGLSLGGTFGPATVVGLFVTPLLIGLMLPALRQRLGSQ